MRTPNSIRYLLIKAAKYFQIDFLCDICDVIYILYSTYYFSSFLCSILAIMSESGLPFVHSDKDTADQANNMVSEYKMDILVSKLAVANIVFGSFFVVLDLAESEFDFLEQLSPKYTSIQNSIGRHEG